MIQEKPSHRAYWLLLIMQSGGAALMLAVGWPFYLEVANSAERQRPLAMLLLVYACVAMTQIAYWLGYRRFPARGLGGHVVLGHLVVFASRLCFVLVSSTFCVVYIVRSGALNIRPSGLVLVTFTLFALFCYTRELERIGVSLLGPRLD